MLLECVALFAFFLVRVYKWGDMYIASWEGGEVSDFIKKIPKRKVAWLIYWYVAWENIVSFLLYWYLAQFAID